MQKRFVSIWFPHLAIDWHLRKQPHLRDIRFVLKALSHHRMTITAVSPLAAADGIHKGMTVADAKALLSDLHAIDDKPGLVDQLLQSMAEWCIRFTPIASPQLPDGIVLDVTGCVHLWGGEGAYVADIIKRFATRGYTVRASIANTVGAAWATVRYRMEERIIESGKQLQAILYLPVASLRLEEETIALLHKLGLQKVKDITGIPQSALRRRFGPQLLKRLRQASGEEEEYIQPVYPVEAYQERLPCLEPIVTLTGIEIALQRLLDALCNRLRKEGKGLRTAFFRCYRMDGGAQGIEIGTARPSHKEKHLFHLFSLKLSTIEPAAGIELFILEATKVEDHQPSQQQLWEQCGGVGDQALSELMDRLAGKVGSDAIHRYLPAEHYLPERSYIKASSLNEQPTSAWRTDKPRPLQLLLTPERIEVTAPIPDYPPMNFRYKNLLHKILKADGPERIEQEWWIEEGEHRDYYCVEDEEGRRYWLFRSGHYTADKTHQWYLHGFFA